jgi:N-acetylglucosamine-6-phosphate deacetylase
MLYEVPAYRGFVLRGPYVSKNEKGKREEKNLLMPGQERLRA